MTVRIYALFYEGMSTDERPNDNFNFMYMGEW